MSKLVSTNVYILFKQREVYQELRAINHSFKMEIILAAILRIVTFLLKSNSINIISKGKTF